ncbi:hypothetical protein [Chromobacterium amazonense]|uniref:hypothetical protein n=1 Tax=Chromobacterium amazonense TaxID=1382803 RepID=UPI0011B1CC01|nr:hypothetical protein [Chromobacterium amazonense]
MATAIRQRLAVFACLGSVACGLDGVVKKSQWGRDVVSSPHNLMPCAYVNGFPIKGLRMMMLYFW